MLMMSKQLKKKTVALVAMAATTRHLIGDPGGRLRNVIASNGLEVNKCDVLVKRALNS